MDELEHERLALRQAFINLAVRCHKEGPVPRSLEILSEAFILKVRAREAALSEDDLNVASELNLLAMNLFDVT